MPFSKKSINQKHSKNYNQTQIIMDTDKTILQELKKRFASGIEDYIPFPKPFPDEQDPLKVKAIMLGCDPSNSRKIRFTHVFAQGEIPEEFKAFVTTHTNQLNSIGLSWNDIFTQNLCRNYFVKETGKNLTLWKKAAREFWIEEFKNELAEKGIPAIVPVLLTSKYLYDVLVTDDNWKSKSVDDFYSCKVSIPVPAGKNLLNRPLIPLYRGRNPNLAYSYFLENGHWEEYRNRIIKIVQKHN